MDVAPVTPAPATAPAPSASGPHPLVFAGFAIAAAGLVTFGIAGGVTLSEDARLRGSCSPLCPASETGTIAITGVVSDIGAAIGLAGAVLGVVGLVLPTGSGDTVTARLGPGGVSIAGTF